jgi:hypothetical protein
VYGKERRKNRKIKKSKNMCMRECKRVIEKEEKRKEEWQERYERDESSERKIKVQGRMSRC